MEHLGFWNSRFRVLGSRASGFAGDAGNHKKHLGLTKCVHAAPNP